MVVFLLLGEVGVNLVNEMPCGKNKVWEIFILCFRFLKRLVSIFLIKNFADRKEPRLIIWLSLIN